MTEEVMAALVEAHLKTAAAMNALRHGRPDDAGVWIAEVVRAAARLEREWAARPRERLA